MQEIALREVRQNNAAVTGYRPSKGEISIPEDPGKVVRTPKVLIKAIPGCKRGSQKVLLGQSKGDITSRRKICWNPCKSSGWWKKELFSIPTESALMWSLV